MDSPDTLDIHEAAAMLHADEETVLMLARSGELPGTKIGRPWVFLRADVLDFLRTKIGADTAHRKQAAAANQPAAVAVVAPRPTGRRTKLLALPDLHTLPAATNRRSP